ncbi:MAG: hypothetical protein A3F09_04040 [Chlamydiae bacterium RIFCSPHIGHO2_12_FULL_49_11]|nr:MAG: hypothetical protein A3F09_04040 [Chlamydiae bacterium RIFCSPHIGHO2_12_FULL_49_11]
MDCKKALAKLLAGNDRYVHDRLAHPNRDHVRRESLVSRQNPFAVIVCCSDSRVSPETLFDQDVGDLFVVRVAGNVIGPLQEESIRFAVSILGASIILVMGHENCGAVNAVLENRNGDIPNITALIRPVISQMQNPNLEEAIRKNADNMAHYLTELPSYSEKIATGSLGIHSAYYYLTTGSVEIHDLH